MRGRRIESILARIPEPEVEPPIQDLVKRPTVAQYRHVQESPPAERLRQALALTAFAERFGEQVRAARS